MAEFVYFTCMLTSAFCFLLLVLNYRMNRNPLLLWCAVCFLGLTVNNALLFYDLVIIPNGPDLAVLRTMILAISMSTLIYGFVWENK